MSNKTINDLIKLAKQAVVDVEEDLSAPEDQWEKCLGIVQCLAECDSHRNISEDVKLTRLLNWLEGKQDEMILGYRLGPINDPDTGDERKVFRTLLIEIVHSLLT